MAAQWLTGWPTRADDIGEKHAVKTLLFVGENGSGSNVTRLNNWKFKWLSLTGTRPVNLYTVSFCRTCNKPIWTTNAKHRHLTVYCPGH